MSWNLTNLIVLSMIQSHAPRERVSWNTPIPRFYFWTHVTLHVSVWVEIKPISEPIATPMVTLHVSVWVEIHMYVTIFRYFGSRSTWACELKSAKVSKGITAAGHAPRERVSWNNLHFCEWHLHFVTLHVSVWVEIKLSLDYLKTIQSRSTWACELKWIVQGCQGL